jgi:hypothetical protein
MQRHNLLLAASMLVFAGCASEQAHRRPEPNSLPAGYQAVAPEEAALVEKEMCQKVDCVFDARIVLRKKDGSVFDKTYHALPVVQPQGVSVYAGQSVLFEADVLGEHLANPRMVSTVEHPEKTLSAKLEQDNDGSMMLSVHNPFDHHLKISMGIMTLDHDNLIKTTSCPVVAGGSSFELWPYPVFQVWLGEMRLLKDASEMNCSE